MLITALLDEPAFPSTHGIYIQSRSVQQGEKKARKKEKKKKKRKKKRNCVSVFQIEK